LFHMLLSAMFSLQSQTINCLGLDFPTFLS